MLPRFRSSIILAFVFVTIFLLIARSNNFQEYGQHTLTALKDSQAAKGLVGYVTGQGGGKFSADGGGSVKEDRPELLAPNNGGENHSPPDGPASEWRTTPGLKPQEQYLEEYEHISKSGRVGAIYGNTLPRLDIKTGAHDKSKVSPSSEKKASYAPKPAEIYNPYPDYNSEEWRNNFTGNYVKCETPWSNISKTSDQILVYTGQLMGYPMPSFGSYDLLNIDKQICYERYGRLGPYGYDDAAHPDRKKIDWENVSWGDLQRKCLAKNENRYDVSPKGNNFIEVVMESGHVLNSTSNSTSSAEGRNATATAKRKTRTALLLRAYSGKTWTENDKINIRSMVKELSLDSGGEYEVFLLVQIKEDGVPLWSNDAEYDKAVQRNVPQEFWDMTILWNDAMIRAWYPALPEKVSDVHVSQWLSVQRFAQERPEFDYYWNWELDSRYTGHHYDLLEKLSHFAEEQPRKGLWERNERFYIPSLHGDYATEFRKSVQSRSTQTIWQAPILPDVDPIGPKPPVKNPEDDDYEWGVGEPADYITLGPIFNPNGTAWVGGPDVWGYKLGASGTPRRTTIITQSRCSKRLLDTMHLENLAGNHVSSEMTPQTVALHHGLKAVYAPHPVFFDREWKKDSLERWFNPGPEGQSGSGLESPFGWGREGRFAGSTWYYRAEAPMRLYNNWMGWEDSGIGGKKWEKINGRACLPAMLLHPIKDAYETTSGYSSVSELPYHDVQT